MLPLKCAGTKPPLLGLSFHRTNTCFLTMSMFVYVLACSNKQYYDESFEAQRSVGGFSGKEFIFTKYSLQLISLPTVFHDQGDVLSHPVSE